jgi:hypothetical protein
VFGEGHPRTLKAAHNLAAARRLQHAAESPRQGDSNSPNE